jgi:TP901 family phage tail tape measure protein
VANYSLGRAEGEIGLKYTGGPAVDKAKTDVDGLQKKAERGAGPAFDRMGRRASIAGATIAGGFALAINAAANFEQRLSGIQAVSGATADDMDKIRKKALQLGKDTKFSATEAAQAMEELAKAGISLPDILNGAADAAVALAAAGEIDLPQAAELASNAMNVFSLKARELPKVADLIAGAANASAISVSEFGQSLQQSGAAANLAGLDFDDLATAIALMGNAGIKGSDAGTSLKTMLLNLQPQTKKQTTLMSELGIVTKDGSNRFFDAQGNAKSFAEIAGVLQTALKGMTAEQKTAALEVLFGSDAIRAAAVVSKAGSAGFTNMAKAMGKVKAADVAAVRMNNLKGQIETMKGSLETAAIQIGTTMIPRLTAMAKKAGEAANGFSELDKSTQDNIIHTVQITGAVLLFAAALNKTVRFVQEFIAVMKVLGIIQGVALLMRKLAVAVRFLTASLMLNPFVLAAVALIALGAAIFLAYKRSATFRKIVQTVFTWIKENVLPILNAVWRGIVVAFNAIVSFAKSFATSFMSVWNSVWAAIAPVVRVVFTIISTYIRFVINVILVMIKIWTTQIRIAFAVFNALRPIITAVFGFIMTYIQTVFAFIKLIITVQIAVIVTVIRVALFAIRIWWKVTWAIVSTIVKVHIAIIRAVISTGMAVIGAIVRAVVGAMRAVWNAFWNGPFGAVVRAAIGTVVRVIGTLRSIVSTGKSIIGDFAKGIANGIKNVVTSIINGTKDMLRPIADLASKFFHAGVEIIAALIRGITSMLGKVKDTIGKVTSAVGKFIPGSPVEEGPLRVLNRGGAGSKIVQMLIDGINAKRSDLVDASRGMVSGMPTTILGTSSALVDSAARTGLTATGPAGPATAVLPPGLERSLSDAVMEGMSAAKLMVGRDGIARLVFDTATPFVVKGARR